MIKCAFCEKSVPTKSCGGWECFCNRDHRQKQCIEAIKRMMDYNETRAGIREKEEK